MKNELTDLSLEELKSKKKTYGLTTGMMFGFVLVMAIVGISDYYRSQSFNFTQILALFFIPLLVSNYLKIKKISNEINSREGIV